MGKPNACDSTRRELAQEGGCIAVEGGIVLETLRMDEIVEIDETNGTSSKC